MTMVTTISTEQKSIVVFLISYISTMPNPVVVLNPELISTHPEWESPTELYPSLECARLWK